MFLKVFKYDFRALFFKFLPVLAILPVLSIIVRVVNLIPCMDNVFILLVKMGANSLFMLGCVFLFIYTLVICIIRYVKSLFRDQGYLTHTLPVTKHSLLLSNLFADFLMQIISFLVVVLCLVIGYLTPNIWDTVVEFFGKAFEIAIVEEELAKMLAGTSILVLFSLLFSAFQSLFVIYTGVAIGHAFAKNKGILSVVFCIAINYALGIFGSILMGIYGLVTRQFNFTSLTINEAFGYINIYLGISLAFNIIVCVIGYFVDIYLMKEKLNLE